MKKNTEKIVLFLIACIFTTISAMEERDQKALADDTFVAQFFEDPVKIQKQENLKKRKRFDFETEDNKEVSLSEELTKRVKIIAEAQDSSIVTDNNEESKAPFPGTANTFYKFRELLEIEEKIESHGYYNEEERSKKVAEDIKTLSEKLSFEELVNLAQTLDYFENNHFSKIIDSMYEYLKTKGHTLHYDVNLLRENNRIEEKLIEKIRYDLIKKYYKSLIKEIGKAGVLYREDILFFENHCKSIFNTLTLEQLLLLLHVIPSDGKIKLSNKQKTLYKSLPKTTQDFFKDFIF